jgi:hypothetical protein
MAYPIQTTELSAVNTMLSSIGERPVNSLTAPQRLDVIRAVQTLNEVNVLVQTRGWWFNEEKNVTLSPNAAGEYEIEANAIKVDPTLKWVDHFVVRGNKLYNTKTHSFTNVDDIGTLHTDDIKIDYIALQDFNDIPETARMYIARRAGVIYQTRSVGSPTLFEFTERDAQESWGSLLMEEVEHVDTNLTLAPGIFDAVWNR